MLAERDKSLFHFSKKILKNSTVVFLGQAISLLANLAVTVMLVRYLGESGFGIFSYGLVFISFFALIADFGMKPIVVRELARADWDPGQLFGNAIIIKIALSSIAIFLAVTTAKLAGYSEKHFIVIAFLALNILITPKLSTLRVIFEAPFNADLEMYIPMLLQFFDSLLLVGAIYILTSLNSSLELLVFIYVISNVPGVLLNVYMAKRKIPYHFHLNRQLIRFLLKESLPIWLYTILITFLGGVDVFFIEHLQGESAVGLYSAASRLTAPLLFIPHAIIVSLFPLFSRYYEKSKDNVTLVFQLGFKAILLIGLALAITTTFLGTRMIELLYSSPFAESTQPLVILMWSTVFLFLNFYFIETLTSTNQQKVAFYVAAVMLFANILLNWYLVRADGIVGAAIAKLCSSALGFILLVISVKKSFSFPMASFFLRFLIMSLFFSAGVAYLSRLPFVVSVVSTMAIFLTLTLISGIFNQKERAIFQSIIRNIKRGR